MTFEPEPRQLVVHVTPDGYQLITSGAHYLHMTKSQLVETAVEVYLNSRRDEMEAGMCELLGSVPADGLDAGPPA